LARALWQVLLPHTEKAKIYRLDMVDLLLVHGSEVILKNALSE
jgi:hypothetical protein